MKFRVFIAGVLALVLGIVSAAVQTLESRSPDTTLGILPAAYETRGSVPAEGSAEAVSIGQEVIDQAPIIQARFELEKAAARTGVDGLATINAKHEDGRIDLYWKGDVPPLLAEAVERVDEKFEVVVHDAPYSFSEIEKEIKRILALKAERTDLAYVVGATATHDLSGIRILVSKVPGNINAARSAINSRVTLRFEEASWVAKFKPAVAGWRWDDQPPYIGGAVIERPILLGLDVVRCSTAFTARTAADNIRGVFTAKHCGERETWRTAVGQRNVGVSNLIFSDIDVAGIFWPTSTPGYPGFTGQVYSAVFNGSATRNVTGSGWSGLNDIYCTSGGYSGSNCRQRVIDRNIFLGDPFGGPLFLTEQMDGIAAVGSGDSGGPIYSAGTGTIARGVISAVALDRPNRQCVGWNPDNDRECSDWALHGELQPVLNALGMTVIS